jgi:hypothetical protein
MTISFTQAAKSRTDVKVPATDLDLGIKAISAAVVRCPHAAGAMDLRATRLVLDGAVRVPHAAGASTLRATKTVLTVG